MQKAGLKERPYPASAGPHLGCTSPRWPQQLRLQAAHGVHSYWCARMYEGVCVSACALVCIRNCVWICASVCVYVSACVYVYIFVCCMYVCLQLCV